MERKSMEDIFTQEELEIWKEGIKNTYISIEKELKEYYKKANKEFTLDIASQNVIDAYYLVLYGEVDGEQFPKKLYGRMMEKVNYDSIFSFSKNILKEYFQ